MSVFKSIILIFVALVMVNICYQIISNHSNVEKYRGSFTEPDNQYVSLLNLNSPDSLHLNICFVSKIKSPISFYRTKTSELIIYKLPLKINSNIYNDLKLERGYESVETLNGKECIRGRRSYFDLNLCFDSFPSQNNVVFKFDGDSLTTHKINDSTISCNMLIRSFNLQYTDTGETDIRLINTRSDKYTKFNFCLLSRNKNTYFISMCSNLHDYNIPDDEIIRLLN